MSPDQLLYDVRFAMRGLWRARGFTVTAIAMLALALGLNVTVFTLMDTMLFRGAPLVQRPDRLLYLQERLRSGNSPNCCILLADVEQWRSQATAFQGIAYTGGRAINFRNGEGRPLDTQAWMISSNTFSLLGVPPLLGRDFVPADEAAGAPGVAILSYRFWETRFGARANAIGMTVQIDGAPTTIIGVMPRRFEFPLKQDLWLPATHSATQQSGFSAVGRLRDGFTREQARVQLETIGRRLEAEHPETNRNLGPTLASHAEFNNGRNATVIWGSLWIAACFVLMIACANLVNLTLVRTLGRSREISTRIALGAGQWRVMRQMILETLLLTAVAATLSWWVVNWCVQTWADVTESKYQVLDYAVDSRTLAYLFAVSIVAATLCSLAPVASVLHTGVNGILKGDARGATQSLGGKRLAAALVAAQMTLAIVLLSGTGVLGRSFLKIVGADSGVPDPEHIVIGSTRLPSDKYPAPDARSQYFDLLEARLKAIPGVEQASIGRSVPVKFAALRPIDIEGRSTSPNGPESVGFVPADADYFAVLKVSPSSGRVFTTRDQATSMPVAIVNRAFADRFWPGEQVIGKRIRTVEKNLPGDWRTVVGVVPNLRHNDPLRQEFRPLVYIPFRQDPAPLRAYFLIRAAAPERIEAAVLSEVQKLDSDVTLTDFGTLRDSFAFDRDFMDAEHSELRKHAVVATIFAVIALLLAAMGLYAVIAHSIGQRTREIGIRMAIGAVARDISRMVFRDGLRPVAMGILLGLAASLAVNRMLGTQLVGVSPYDPATMTTAPVLLMLVALLACQLPARRAARVDPAVALRHD